MTPPTHTDANPPRRGLLSRLIGGVRAWFKRMFGKDDNPDIYPFF